MYEGNFINNIKIYALDWSKSAYGSKAQMITNGNETLPHDHPNSEGDRAPLWVPREENGFYTLA
jgi:hypothetical protein